MNFNQVVLAGNLVRDPELSYTQNQKPVANFDIAVNFKSGEYENTSFFSCSAFGKTGENIVKYFSKGSNIFVVGRLQQDRWQNEQGQNRSRIKINVNSFQFTGNLGKNSNSKNNSDDEDVFK